MIYQTEINPPNKWMNKNMIYTIEYYSTIKRMKFCRLTAWMNLEKFCLDKSDRENTELVMCSNNKQGFGERKFAYFECQKLEWWSKLLAPAEWVFIDKSGMWAMSAWVIFRGKMFKVVISGQPTSSYFCLKLHCLQFWGPFLHSRGRCAAGSSGTAWSSVVTSRIVFVNVAQSK